MTVSNGEYFDSQAVSSYEGKFSGTFDLDEEIGSKMKFGDIVMFLVTAEIGRSEITASKSGDLKRSNRCDVIVCEEVDAETGRLLKNVLDDPAAFQQPQQPQFTFTGGFLTSDFDDDVLLAGNE